MTELIAFDEYLTLLHPTEIWHSTGTVIRLESTPIVCVYEIRTAPSSPLNNIRLRNIIYVVWLWFSSVCVPNQPHTYYYCAYSMWNKNSIVFLNFRFWSRGSRYSNVTVICITNNELLRVLLEFSKFTLRTNEPLYFEGMCIAIDLIHPLRVLCNKICMCVCRKFMWILDTQWDWTTLWLSVSQFT